MLEAPSVTCLKIEEQKDELSIQEDFGNYAERAKKLQMNNQNFDVTAFVQNTCKQFFAQ